MDRAFFVELSIAARSAIAAECAKGLVAETKNHAGFDPVTSADRAAELRLRTLIAQRFPTHGISGEEYELTRGESVMRWSLDPIDGTRALLCGLPSWAILVGLIEDGRHIAGMIDLPWLDEILIGHGGVTQRNGKVVRTSNCSTIAEARLTTTDPNLFDKNDAKAFERVRRTARLTRFGLDSLGYARVATGDIDLVIESGLKPHDYDAIVPVVRGAGGHVGDWRGEEQLNTGRIIAAANRPLYDEAVALLA